MEQAADSTVSLRILVVDDDHDTADSCAQLAALWGHEARAVYDGATALKAVTTYQPHVILLDLEMPGMDGYEVRHWLHARQDLAVIAISGHCQKEVLERTNREGFFCHLSKPVDLLCLQGILADLKVAAVRKRQADQERLAGAATPALVLAGRSGVGQTSAGWDPAGGVE